MVDNKMNYSFEDLLQAIKKGDLESVKKIVDNGVDPADRDNLAVRFAAFHNRPEIVKFLISLPEVDPSIDHNYVFIYMAGYGHTNILRLLMTYPNVDPSDNDNGAIEFATSANRIDTVRYIWSLRHRFPTIENAFVGKHNIIWKARDGNLEMVKLLIHFPGMNTPEIIDRAIGMASDNGHEEIVKFLTEYTTREKYTEQDLLNTISDNNDLERVKAIIDSGVDPTFGNNRPIIVAAIRNQPETVKFLLSLPEVDPSAQENHLFIVLARNGHTDILRQLMTYPNVDPTAQHNWAIRSAAAYNHPDTVRYIWSLRDRFPSIRDAFVDRDLIVWKAKEGNLEMVKLLIQFPGMNTPEIIDRAIGMTSRNNHPEIVEFLENYKTAYRLPTIEFPHIIPFTLEMMPDLT